MSPACRAPPASRRWRPDMYVAVKGGEAAIANAHALLADRRRGDRGVPALRLDQIVEQLGLGVDRVMTEGSLYDRELAALAVMQARGDMIEAIFLVRAYRTTLPRFGHLQGPSGRAVAGPDIRLHPPPARSGAGRWRGYRRARAAGNRARAYVA